MRITNVIVDGFGLFGGRFELGLTGSIALIVGDNETGKSTLLLAITTILFGLGREEEKKAFAPYGTASPRSGELEVEKDGARYRFRRDFGSNDTKVERVAPDSQLLFEGSAKPAGRTDEKERYDSLMRELFGIESEELFRNSALVEQSSIETEMGGIVRRIASGSSTADYAVVLDTLRENCDDLCMELPWRRAAARKPRRIEVLQAELQEKKNLLVDVRVAGTTVDELRTRLDTAESEVAVVSKDLESQKQWESVLTSFLTASEDNKRLKEQVSACRNELRDIERLNDELKRISETIAEEYRDYVSIPEGAEADMAALAQREEHERELSKQYEEAEKKTIYDVARIRSQWLFIVIGIVIALAGVGFLEGLLRVVAVLVGIAVGISPRVLLFFELRAHESERRGRLNTIGEQLETARAQSAEIRKRYPQLAHMTPTDLLNGLRKIRTLQFEKEKKGEALKEHSPLPEVEAKYDRLCNEHVIANTKLEELIKQNPSLRDIEQRERVGGALEDARKNIARYQIQLRELSRERENLVVDLAKAEAREVGSEETLEEEIAEMERELSRLKLDRDAYILADRVLGEAISEFRSSHLERIQERTTEYLSRITGEPYRVTLDEDLNPLGVEQAGSFFELSQLSQGVRDQLYFALRLATAEEISGTVRLPLLLDDPFVNFDEKRLKATFEMLQRISESHQVVLFTHDRTYCDWQEPACVLEK